MNVDQAIKAAADDARDKFEATYQNAISNWTEAAGQLKKSELDNKNSFVKPDSIQVVSMPPNYKNIILGIAIFSVIGFYYMKGKN